MGKRFFAEKLFNGEHILSDVLFSVEQGKIVSLSLNQQVPNDDEVTYLGGLVSAGFIDVHINGGGGALFNNQPDVKAIKTIAQAHAKFGTTSILPTLITDGLKTMKLAADAVSQAIAEDVPGILGVHFEGPHLSSPKRGVHLEKWIRAVSEDEMAIFSRTDLGIKLVTLAPENVSTDLIENLTKEHNVLVSLGHSNADYDTAKAALDAGANGFTHLYNAMSPLQSRAPGMVGIAIDDEQSWCGIILDGHHMDAVAARIAYKAKPKGKLMLVTDAMSPVGTDESHFEFFDTHIVRTGDRLNAPTGELAGSVLDMASAVRNAVSMLNIEVGEALNMASLYPAEYLGLAAELGCLQVGKQADFVVLDQDLVPVSTWHKGNIIYSRGN